MKMDALLKRSDALLKALQAGWSPSDPETVAKELLYYAKGIYALTDQDLVTAWLAASTPETSWMDDEPIPSNFVTSFRERLECSAARCRVLASRLSTP